jgi:hypothetical protein
MWLFVGRYAHLGGAMCLITLAVVSVGIIFMTIAVRVIQRPDLRIANAVTILVVIILASFFGFAVGSGEQVFVSDRLNVGEALFLAVAGTLLGSTAAIMSNRFRGLRVLILIAVTAMLFGDLTGWLLRSAGPSKYTSPAGWTGPKWNFGIEREALPETVWANRTVVT